MRFTVIIPTCNRNDLLALCLDRLAPGKQTLSSEHYQVIVTDDGTTSSAQQMLAQQYPWARWTQGPRRGPAANRNQGASCASTSWLVFTDDDCLPTAGWLQAFFTAQQSSKVAALEGQTRSVGEKDHPLAQCPINETGGFLWSCNFAIERELFVSLGGFDERFPYASMEDMDFHTRVKNRGIVPTFVPEALIHHPWKVLANPARYMRQHLFSQMLYVKLHPEEKRRVSARNHLHYWARYFVKGLPADLRTYRWRTVSVLPGLTWRVGYSAWVLFRQPGPDEIRPR